MAAQIDPGIRQSLQRGLVIPACPLALNAGRKMDERRQRALVRYYTAAGAGGLAVGVHTSQFAIRDPEIGLFQPLLELAREELVRADSTRHNALVKIGGICGKTPQAVNEAELLRSLGYHAGLVSLGSLRTASDDELLTHCRAVAEIIPIIGFYLQPAAGGRILPFSFWRRFVEIEAVVAIKIAPFNRYQTLDVIRAVVESGRDDIALYTGNDDNIVLDLLSPFEFREGDRVVRRHFGGGLLGHWAVWTRKAVELHATCRQIAERAEPLNAEMLRLANCVTDANAAVFDAANGFSGCIAGIHEILRRQGLLEGIWCLDPTETLGPGQREELDRVSEAYPELTDDDFVAAHRDEWLRG